MMGIAALSNLDSISLIISQCIAVVPTPSWQKAAKKYVPGQVQTRSVNSPTPFGLSGICLFPFPSHIGSNKAILETDVIISSLTNS
jgi:hypothetical protein